MKKQYLPVLLLAWAGCFLGSALAQSFPSKPLRIVVPFPPGGAADIASRILAEQLGKGLGQSVLIENRPGGSTILGSELVARSAPDGHTMLVVFPSFIVNPSLRPSMPFAPLKDFKAVGQTMSVPMAIAVHPSLPVNTLPELIALARAKPGEISYGTPGTGTTHHIMGEMLSLSHKIQLMHTPFQGAGPALTSISGGHVKMVYLNATELAPFVKSGRLRALVVTSAERAEVMPDVPTMREAGFPELEASNWSGMVVASATPPAVIARLNAELTSALRHPETAAKLKGHGMTPMPGSPEQFAEFLQTETLRYSKTVREAGIKVD